MHPADFSVARLTLSWSKGSLEMTYRWMMEIKRVQFCTFSNVQRTISVKNQILSQRERINLNLVVEQDRVEVKKIGDGRSIVAGQIVRFPA